MKKIIVILSLFVFTNSICQTINERSTKIGLTNDELTDACKAYEKMIKSETYLESEKKVREFAEKIENLIITQKIPFDSINNREATLKLIKNNLEKTKFKTVAEAEKCINEMISSTERRKKENENLYLLLSKSTPEQIMKIHKPFYDKTKAEYGY